MSTDTRMTMKDSTAQATVASDNYEPYYRCSRNGPGLCYWDGLRSSLAGFNRDRCPVCLSPVITVRVEA